MTPRRRRAPSVESMQTPDARRDLRPQRIAVSVSAVAATVMLVLAPIEELIWAPLAMTDDSYGLEAIYGVFTPTALAVGLVGVAIAFLLGLTAILVFTSFGWRGRLGTHWVHVATLGSMLVWLGLLAMFFAGFGVGNTVSDEIPPYIGRSSSVGELLQILAFAAFLTTVVGAIASLVLAFRSAGVARRAWQASR
jgi:hypothetical protein